MANPEKYYLRHRAVFRDVLHVYNIYKQVSAEGLAYGTEPMQWALLQFQHPVHCPLGSLLIGSRLDTDTSDHPGNSSNSAAGAGMLEYLF